jgi:hypothetical protein
MGIIPCSVNVLDTSHRFAQPVPGNTTKLESSESGNIRLVLPPSATGEQVIDVMLGFGGGGDGGSVPQDLITVPVFYPARQAGCDNAHGLTNEGTLPYEAGNGLYFKNIRPVVTAGFIQPDGNKWKFEYVDGTAFTLNDVALKYANGDMTQWATTDNINDALKGGHRLILPHNAVGYTLGNDVTFKNNGGAATPLLQKEFTFAPIIAEADVTLRKQADNTVIASVEDLVDAGAIKADMPQYQNSKPLVKDVDSIENNCTGKPLLGLWKDGIFPQLLFCENIPYGYCIPLRLITSLVKVNCDDCSPVYNSRKYTVAIGTFGQNQFYVPQNIDYKPSIRCPID